MSSIKSKYPPFPAILNKKPSKWSKQRIKFSILRHLHNTLMESRQHFNRQAERDFPLEHK